MAGWFKSVQRSDEVGDVAQSVYPDLPKPFKCVECGGDVSVEGITCRNCIFSYVMNGVVKMENARLFKKV